MSQLTQEQVAALWTRINAINCELDALSTGASSNILKRDAAQLNMAYEERSAVLRREKVELLGKLPPTGEASGQHMVFARTLGTVYVRASEPEPAPDDGWDLSDPYERFAREMGHEHD